MEVEWQNWFEVKGDETLALDWGLNENSLVWEIGGFEGRWAQQIWDKFHCYIDVFEPQLWAVKRMQERFRGIAKIDIHPYGLWVQDDVLPIGNYHTDGASIIHDDKREESILVAFRDVNKELDILVELYEDINPIDVCLMNIEGAEYYLIPRLCETGDIRKFRNFWCQFHPVIVYETAEEQEKAKLDIYKALSKTHDMIWNCYPTAAAWRLR